MKKPKTVKIQEDQKQPSETGWEQQFIHPGEIIRRRFFQPLNESQAMFCARTGIDKSSFSRILNGVHKITPETATELGAAFGMSAMFFMNLQSQYDLGVAKKKPK